MHSSLDGGNFMPISITDALESYSDIQRFLVPTHPGRSFDICNTYDPPAEAEEVSQYWNLDTLPRDLFDLWRSARECRLHHDRGSGKGGITLLSPPKAQEVTERELEFWDDEDGRFLKSDIIIGTMVVEPDFIVFDTRKNDFNVLLASTLDGRGDWPIVGRNISDFLLRYRDLPGEGHWQRSIV
ncbi:hypothetical protein ACU5JM_19855 [Rhodococcus erythropolis]|uniref:hypothetical protein n=1 Tax=Rhodococcus erythropolis TaxID=1833 RepID=UPI00406BBDC3